MQNLKGRFLIKVYGINILKLALEIYLMLKYVHHNNISSLASISDSELSTKVMSLMLFFIRILLALVHYNFHWYIPQYQLLHSWWVNVNNHCPNIIVNNRDRANMRGDL